MGVSCSSLRSLSRSSIDGFGFTDVLRDWAIVVIAQYDTVVLSSRPKWTGNWALLLVNTMGDWLAELAVQSPFVADLGIDALANPADPLNEDALNLANCPAHCRLIAKAVEGLIAAPVNASADYVRDLLLDLIQRNTYGAFAELAACEWLNRCYVRFQPQVEMTPADVLGANGSTLDGKMWAGPYFDVKAFGFTGRTARRLEERLQVEFPNDQVVVFGSWDIALATFQQLIEDRAAIAATLRATRYFKHGPLEIQLRQRQPVTVSSRMIEPYRVARENAKCALEDAQQFTRNAPFVLLYVIHSWFNAGVIHNDFAGMDTTMTRALARRAFMQFSTDLTPLADVCDSAAPGTTMQEASRLLSGIFFVNVWPQDADPSARRLPSWLYLNPRATHRLSLNTLSLFRNENPHGTYIDDFADDDY
jgi:hypothetical protein